MRRGLLALLISLLFALPAAGQSLPPLTEAVELDRLKWLEGNWKRESSGGGTIHESWSFVSDRTAEGRSWRELPGGNSRVAESMLLGKIGDALFYIPRPRKKNAFPIAFKLVELSDSRAVFENPEHDFPKRIGYMRNDDGSLNAWIEGPTAEGKPHRIDFHFQRSEQTVPTASK